MNMGTISRRLIEWIKKFFQNDEPLVVTKKKGRPKGSKNKPNRALNVSRSMRKAWKKYTPEQKAEWTKKLIDGKKLARIRRGGV
jgi:hypothetical protein